MISNWVKRYVTRGLYGFLNMDYRGRKGKSIIPEEVIEDINIQLGNQEGCGSYSEIQEWMKNEYGIDVAYSTVHKLVKYELHASPKVVRPVSEKKNPNFIRDFQENLDKPLN